MKFSLFRLKPAAKMIGGSSRLKNSCSSKAI